MRAACEARARVLMCRLEESQMRFFGRRVERCLIVDVYNATRRVGADSSKSDYASPILRSVCQLIKARPLPRIWRTWRLRAWL